MHGGESTVLGQISEFEILTDLYSLRYPESVYVFVYQPTLKTNNSRKEELGILNLYHMVMLLKTFCDNCTDNLCTGHTKEFQYITTYGRNFLLIAFYRHERAPLFLRLRN